MFDNILKFFLLSSQLFYIRGMALTNCDVKFFHLGIISLAMASCFDIKKRDLFDMMIPSGLFVVSLLSIIFFAFDNIVVNYTVNLFLFIFGLCLVYQYCDDPRECSKWFCYGVLINVIAMLIQRLGFNPFLEYPRLYPGGFAGNAPRLIMSVCLALPYFWDWSKPVFWSVLLGCAVWGQEVGLYVWGLIFLFIVLKNKYYKVGIILLFLCGCYYQYWHIFCAINERWKILQEVLIEFFNNPFKGCGAGIIPIFKGQIDARRDTQIASSIMKFVSSYGIPGAALLALMIKSFLSSFNRSLPYLAAFGFFILSWFEYPFEIMRLWLPLIFIFAYFLIERREYDESIG